MDAFTVIELPYAALGLGVGLLVDVTGVGGGSLMTPLLFLLFGIHPVTAVGTDLLFAAATKSVGTLVNGLQRTVAWRVTGLLATGSLPAAAATLFLVSRMNLQEQAASHMVHGVLSVVLLLSALSLVGRRYVMALAHTRLLEVGPRGSAVLTVATGVVVGVLVPLTPDRRGCGRHHRPAAALSPDAHRPHRRLRYRARRAAHAAGRHRALDHGLRELGRARLGAARLRARHCRWQLHQRPRPRTPAVSRAGIDAGRRGGKNHPPADRRTLNVTTGRDVVGQARRP